MYIYIHVRSLAWPNSLARDGGGVLMWFGANAKQLKIYMSVD